MEDGDTIDAHLQQVCPPITSNRPLVTYLPCEARRYLVGKSMATVQTLVTYCITLNYLYFSALYPALLLLHRVFPHPLSLFDNLIASMLICHQHWLTREMIAALLPHAVHVGCWVIAQYAVISWSILSSSGCVNTWVSSVLIACMLTPSPATVHV